MLFPKRVLAVQNAATLRQEAFIDVPALELPGVHEDLVPLHSDDGNGCRRFPEEDAPGDLPGRDALLLDRDQTATDDTGVHQRVPETVDRRACGLRYCLHDLPWYVEDAVAVPELNHEQNCCVGR
jgi:hypothetical protein